MDLAAFLGFRAWVCDEPHFATSDSCASTMLATIERLKHPGAIGTGTQLASC